MTPEDITAELDTAVNPRVQKVIKAAVEHGWFLNPKASIVVRLDSDDDQAVPFFIEWNLVELANGKRSWRFKCARAANGQALSYGDIFTYLADPSVIHPEPPEEEESNGPNGDSGAAGRPEDGRPRRGGGRGDGRA